MEILKWFNKDTFCFVFSLQSGTVMSLMTLGITNTEELFHILPTGSIYPCVLVLILLHFKMLKLALTILPFLHLTYFLVVTSSFTSNIVPFSIVYCYMIVLGIGLVFAFIGAYDESTSWMLISCIFTGVAIIYFVIIAILSFFPVMFGYVCFGTRCPDHLWLQKSYWRECDYMDLHGTRSLGVFAKKIIAKEQNSPNELSISSFNNPPAIIKKHSTDEETLSILDGFIPSIRDRPNQHAPRTPRFSSRRREQRSQELPEEDTVINMEETKKNYPDDYSEGHKRTNTDDGSESDGKGKDGRYYFSFIMSIIFVISIIGVLCYSLVGFLSFANELKKELYGYI